MGALSGKVAIITGGGRGLGRAHALLLAEKGASVLVSDLGATADGSGADPTVAVAVVEEIRSLGHRAHADDSDISTTAGASACVEAAINAFGHVDMVINNAGISVGSPFDSIDVSVLDKVMAVNFYGMLAVTAAAWPYLKTNGWGRIVNTVSEVALASHSSASLLYGAAKAAVWSATLALAEEGKPYGITVNAISPGAFTRMNEAMFRATPPPADLDLDPRHVAKVVAWLMTDDAADVTGAVIHAAGGHHREYVISRHRDTPLVARLEEALGRSG